jgi:ferredoxin-NADP reductase
VFLTLPIREIVQATPRSRIVRLDLNGHRFEYAAGQAVLVGTHGRATRRPYSIASAPEDAQRDGWIELLIGIEADGNPGPHLTLASGSSVDVEGPVGSFTFPANPEAQQFVFIAGGTGIAPLRAMLRHALRIPHRDVGLFYSARTPDDFAFQEEFQHLADERRIELRQTVTRDSDVDWRGARGRIDRAALRELIHGPATLCFVCGPPALVDEMKTLLADIGVPQRQIRIEEWG